jgi:hypothetical protein
MTVRKGDASCSPRGTSTTSQLAQARAIAPVAAVQNRFHLFDRHSPVTLAIPGTSSLTHLEENMTATRLSLPSEDLATMDKLA